MSMTNFYVDAVDGNDSNDGLTETKAFQTLSRASAGSNPGVRMLFKRGQVFGGETFSIGWRAATTPDTYIAWGAWGEPSDPKPIITAWKPIASWTLEQGTIYKTTLDAPPVYAVELNDLYYTEYETDHLTVPIEHYYTDGTTLWVNTGGIPNPNEIRIIDDGINNSLAMRIQTDGVAKHYEIRDIAFEACPGTSYNARGLSIVSSGPPVEWALVEDCLFFSTVLGRGDPTLNSEYAPHGIMTDCDNMTISRCEFKGLTDAILLNAQEKILITECYFHSPLEVAFGSCDHIKGYDDADHSTIVIEQCVFEGSYQDHIDCIAQTDGLTIRNNYGLNWAYHPDAEDGRTGFKFGGRNVTFEGNLLFEMDTTKTFPVPGDTVIVSSGRGGTLTTRDNVFITCTQAMNVTYDNEQDAYHYCNGNFLADCSGGFAGWSGDISGGGNITDMTNANSYIPTPWLYVQTDPHTAVFNGDWHITDADIHGSAVVTNTALGAAIGSNVATATVY